MVCPTCGGPYDPVRVVEGYRTREDAFAAAYPQIRCPACRKRVSPRGDSINAFDDAPTVRMLCHHCDHRWTVPRNPALPLNPTEEM